MDAATLYQPSLVPEKNTKHVDESIKMESTHTDDEEVSTLHYYELFYQMI